MGLVAEVLLTLRYAVRYNTAAGMIPPHIHIQPSLGPPSPTKKAWNKLPSFLTLGSLRSLASPIFSVLLPIPFCFCGRIGCALRSARVHPVASHPSSAPACLTARFYSRLPRVRRIPKTEVRTRMFQRMLPVSEHVSCPCSGDRLGSSTGPGKTATVRSTAGGVVEV